MVDSITRFPKYHTMTKEKRLYFFLETKAVITSNTIPSMAMSVSGGLTMPFEIKISWFRFSRPTFGINSR